MKKIKIEWDVILVATLSTLGIVIIALMVGMGLSLAIKAWWELINL